MSHATSSRPWHAAAGIVCLIALAGCASSSTPDTAWTQPQGAQSASSRLAAPEEEEGDTRRGACGAEMTATAGMQISLIRQMLNDDKPRAALAHLDDLSLDTDRDALAEPRLLRGEALRDTGQRDKADAVYETLTETCLAADAWRGIARNQAARGKLETALDSMQRAREARPIDAAIRNDLGYLRLLQGQPRQAENEFLTALELSPDYARAARNLVMALYAQNNDRQAEGVAQRYGIDQEEVALLRQTRLAKAEQTATASSTVSNASASTPSGSGASITHTATERPTEPGALEIIRQ
ncbi:tetratricopeptide repeat protein [Chromohalobacter sp. 296-RDG]|uniref:tetratricopeptide repeat protein n=1 Tax=Chromohalobacter sp. 296-RDG TaxID=2994062 RepID=UPI0024687411|nr:tetratricopeptide repeat protein [Chromohalobacter sp. 296-RDG]